MKNIKKKKTASTHAEFLGVLPGAAFGGERPGERVPPPPGPVQPRRAQGTRGRPSDGDAAGAGRLDTGGAHVSFLFYFIFLFFLLVLVGFVASVCAVVLPDRSSVLVFVNDGW